MKPIIKLNHSSWIFASLGMLFLSLSVYAMEPDTMKMDGGKEKMAPQQNLWVVSGSGRLPSV